jgi:hypothetical protein
MCKFLKKIINGAACIAMMDILLIIIIIVLVVIGKEAFVLVNIRINMNVIIEKNVQV